MTRRWFEIALSVPATLIDEAAALLDYAGFGGVEVREHAGSTDVVVVVQSDDHPTERADDAREAVEVLGCGAPRILELDPKVWTENWKHHFARRTFAGRIEVRPPWEQASSPDLLSIVINPGMAFGTGLHETTATCLEMLCDELEPGMRVADVGCGSGILAIAAARLGASEVLATDVDPLAMDASAENIEANDVEDIVRLELEPGEVGIPQWESGSRPGLSAAREADAAESASGASSTPNGAIGGGFTACGTGAFDLLVANILAETLVEMQGALTAAVREGGVLLLSGIEARRLKMVEEAFIRGPWHVTRTIARGEWVSLCLHHDASAVPVRAREAPTEDAAAEIPLNR